MTLIDNLSDIADEEENEEETEATEALVASFDETDLPDGRGQSVLCMGGRGAIDDAASAMLAQIIEIQGATVASASFGDLAGRASRKLSLDSIDTAVISFLNGNSKSHARQIVRRMKRIKPSLRVGILIPAANGQNYAQIDAADISADFITTSLTEAVTMALTQTTPRELVVVARKIGRPRLHVATPAVAS
jgi:hypothetical protein